ncbi:MAG: LPXTG cell wall anchor domain-containing protein [Actinomycetota bacterium]|nr:LPXTG cell wall anchor domain-containing protein [Actinomycetota bacterium]
MVDGVSVGAVESYSFMDVAADHTIYVDFGIIGQTEVAGITEEDVTVEVLGEMEELPYTGFDLMYFFVGFGALILAGGLMLILKELRRDSA